jgi:competence protein ComGC
LKPLKNFSALRPAFTIIEILISVLIISFSIIYVLKLHTSNHKQIVYISERNNHALEDSLYLTKNILKHHKDKKSAYDILERHIKIKKDESRKLLKKGERSIYIPEEILILPPPEIPGPTAVVNEVKLKGDYPAIFWHIKITGF